MTGTWTRRPSSVHLQGLWRPESLHTAGGMVSIWPSVWSVVAFNYMGRFNALPTSFVSLYNLRQLYHWAWCQKFSLLRILNVVPDCIPASSVYGTMSDQSGVCFCIVDLFYCALFILMEAFSSIALPFTKIYRNVSVFIYPSQFLMNILYSEGLSLFPFLLVLINFFLK